MEVIMKKLFLLLSLLLSSNQLLVSAEQIFEQLQASGSGKNNTCLICGKVFSKKSNLTRHMLSHATANLPRTDNKFKGLKCEYCGDTFTALSSKYKHIERWHQGVALSTYNYQCNCKRRFRSEDEVNGHKARSSDYRCQYDYKVLDQEQVPAVSTGDHPSLTPEQIAIEEQKKQQAAALQQQQREQEKEKEIQRIANELKALAEEEEEIQRIARELQEASYLEI
jgi:hypothetical protein